MNVEIVICDGPHNTCSMCLNSESMVEWCYLPCLMKDEPQASAWMNHVQLTLLTPLLDALCREDSLSIASVTKPRLLQLERRRL